MKYKALILDLDGTTVTNFNSAASTRVEKAIKKLKDSMHVCIATGRPLYAAQPIIEQLGITAPCVLNNGVQMYDPVKKEIIKEEIIDQKVIPEILDILKKFNLKPHKFDGIKDSLISFSESQNPLSAHSIFVPEVLPEIIDDVVTSLSHLPQIVVHKGTSFTEGFLFVDVTSSEASKQHGIVEICRLLDVTRDELIGVGDSYNDFPLLAACGLKIAMGNAVSELKDLADFIAPSVDDDGIAVIIEKLLL